LEDFVKELKDLLNTGILFRKKLLTVRIEAFVCDAPARAFITGTKGHGGYSA
jgi:hypothetical protein